ncbi:MerR family transcriptional regulator [Fredinandcohnia humi]
MNPTFSIGEFSERTGTSIRTLHYYDEIGLLKPKKHPTSGHRLYVNHDLLTLQKIVTFKFLGYSLDQIREILNESSFDTGLTETLALQKKALEEKKEHIESALAAIKRTITLLEEEGEVDSAVLISLINGIQTEKEQIQWLQQRMSSEIVEHFTNKPEEELVALDKEYIRLSKEVKRLFGTPVQDPEVQAMLDKYIKATFAFIGEEAMHALAEFDISDAANLEKMVPSPYTPEEEEWLNQAMEYFMSQQDMDESE